jgi:hypothetical protein
MNSSRKFIDVLIALLVAAVVLSVLLGTSRDYALVFDEAFTVDREMTLADWFRMVLAPPHGSRRSDFFSREALENYWRFIRQEPDGHPPFYALLGLAGWSVAREWVRPPASYRFGPMALAAATAGLLYLFLAKRYSRLVGLTPAVVFVFMPRTFTHAHTASYDMPVTCLWLLAQVAFLKSVRSARWVIAFGVVLGLAASTKLTGWFAVSPPLAWCAIYEGIPLAWRLLRKVVHPADARGG